MKSRWRAEQDEWTKDEKKITSSENLNVIRNTIEKSPIIVERWFYRGGRSPERIIFEDFEDFENYLNEDICAGDLIYIWDFGKLCRNENAIAFGKCPNENDEVPRKGAY